MVAQKFAFVLAVLAAPSLALADKKPLPGSQHQPPVFLDETGTWVTLATSRDAYGIRARLRVAGSGGKHDRLRVEWKQGGKVLATLKCENDGSGNEENKAWGVVCVHDDRNVTALGAIDADVIFTDDETGTDYLVRTLHVTAKKWTEIGKDRMWQIVPDDLLGGAWARVHNRDGEHPQFVFWIERHQPSVNTSMRCTVDGKKIEDIDADLENEDLNSGHEIQADHVQASGPHQDYHWTHVSLEPKAVFTGTKAGAKDKGYVGNVDGGFFLADHAGKWECKVRDTSDGKTFRELTFNVDATGYITSDEMNTGKGAIPTVPGVVMVDMRIPKDSKFDERIRPEAMKKSFGFGIPWPDHPKVKQLHASFPAASGLPD